MLVEGHVALEPGSGYDIWLAVDGHRTLTLAGRVVHSRATLALDADARVRFAGTMSGFGNVVWLDHGGTILSVYAHLSSISVRQGDFVRRGEIVGLSGATGNVTAPHLHFEVWRGGREVDPVPLFGGPPEA